MRNKKNNNNKLFKIRKYKYNNIIQFNFNFSKWSFNHKSCHFCKTRYVYFIYSFQIQTNIKTNNKNLGSKVNKITEITNDFVGVQIAAPPVDGKANEELVDYFSELLKIKKRSISLDKGSRDRNKILLIQETSVQHVQNVLENAMKEWNMKIVFIYKGKRKQKKTKNKT